MYSQSPITVPSQRKRPFQFSILALLVATTVCGVALAYPEFALFTPFVIGLSVITVASIVLVAAVSLVVAEDRRFILKWAWRSLWPILAVNAMLVAYFVYAIYAIDWTD